MNTRPLLINYFSQLANVDLDHSVTYRPYVHALVSGLPFYVRAEDLANATQLHVLYGGNPEQPYKISELGEPEPVLPPHPDLGTAVADPPETKWRCRRCVSVWRQSHLPQRGTLYQCPNCLSTTHLLKIESY